ncbi:MAG: cell division protein FtsL [Deltaproteobacteria bacterium]|jgi:cell division protein FtsL|nr:cell division protein FtsL [Deltaproteobacteria bacterium]
MGLFSFFPKNGAPLERAAFGFVEPKWKRNQKTDSKSRSRLLDKKTLESLKRPEDQLLARLPNESLGLLSLPNFFIIVIAAGLVILALLVIIRVSHDQNALGMEISRLTNYQVELNEQNRRLKIELARLSGLDEVEVIARRDLGMVSPSQGQIIVIDQ